MTRLEELVAQARTKGLYVHVVTPSGFHLEHVTWDAVVIPQGVFYIMNGADWANTERCVHGIQGDIEEGGSWVRIRTDYGLTLTLDTLEGGFDGDQEAIANAIAEREARERFEGAAGVWRDEWLTQRRGWFKPL